MKSLFTRLTENIGDSLAQNINKNILQEKLHIDKDSSIYKLSDFTIEELIPILKQENPDLLKELDEFVKGSKGLYEIGKKKNVKNRTTKPDIKNNKKTSSSSNGSCGRSTRYGGSCGRSNRYGGSCGSSRSYSGGGC